MWATIPPRILQRPAPWAGERSRSPDPAASTMLSGPEFPILSFPALMSCRPNGLADPWRTPPNALLQGRHEQCGSHLSSRLWARSEEHTSELQSLMRTSYAVFCLKKKQHEKIHHEK